MQPMFSSQAERVIKVFVLLFCLHSKSSISSYTLMDSSSVPLLGKCTEEAGREAQSQGCVEEPSRGHGFPGRAAEGAVARSRSGSTAEV